MTSTLLLLHYAFNNEIINYSSVYSCVAVCISRIVDQIPSCPLISCMCSSCLYVGWIIVNTVMTKIGNNNNAIVAVGGTMQLHDLLIKIPLHC